MNKRINNNRRTMRSRRGRGRTMGSNLIPYANSPVPIPYTPPVTPVTVISNPRKTTWIDIDLSSEESGIYTLAVGSYRNRITKLGPSKPNFIIEKVAAYAAPGDYKVVLNDFKTGIQVVDEGSYAHRAAVGILYPPAAQIFYGISATGTLNTITTTAKDPVPVVRALVTYWDSEQ
ncbi:capsid protein [Extra small virus]|uniref:Capsid protein n=2 Tax=Extra small virus TaxID=230604 RepID=Q6X9P4_9VIRU|nr:capsid protein [Extra small virus]AAP41855.1 capsid protein [Extra small virus]